MHALTRPPWLGVARRFELAAPRSLVFFIILLTEHTHARARVLTLIHARSLRLTYARTQSLFRSLCSLFSFSYLSPSTFIGFRMGSRMQQPFSTGSIIILPLSLPPSLALSLPQSLPPCFSPSLSLSLSTCRLPHTLTENTLVDGHRVPVSISRVEFNGHLKCHQCA